MADRPTFVFANWKMNLSRAEALGLAGEISSAATVLSPGVRIALFASHPHLDAVSQRLGARPVCELGAQDVATQAPGAFTGAVSAEQLAELGVRWVLVGHSERRHVFGEDDATVRAKLQACLRTGMRPLLCVGEDLDQREAGHTEQVVLGQLRAALKDAVTTSHAFAVAYEPVWAIGTGRHAEADEAQRVHALLRDALAELLGADRAAGTPILYGGSVSPENARAYFEQQDVDGALVGGASLRAASFLAIAARARDPI